MRFISERPHAPISAKPSPESSDRVRSFGRIAFGASALLFGVITFFWRDPDAWENLPIVALPFGTLIAALLATAQSAGGIGALARRTARPASLLLLGVYTVFSLSCVPAIIAGPRSYGNYGEFFEFLSLMCGALAVYASVESDDSRSAWLGRTVRLGFGACMVSFMLAQVFYPEITASLVPGWIPPNRTFWVAITTIAFGLGAVAILIDRGARIALHLTAVMLGLFGALVWVPILIAHPEVHFNWSEFALNALIAAAAWTIAGLKSL